MYSSLEIAEPATRTAILNVAAVAARLAIVMLEITALVAAGTV
jgi:hypothetical protein